MLHRLIPIAVLGILATTASADSPSFAKDVQPLLQTKCVKCHGDKTRKADLDLSTSMGILKGGESGPVMVAGKPDKSLLYEKVHAGEMPPKKDERLSEAQIDLIRRWIADGAKMDAVEQADAVSQHDIGPIVMRRCTTCHGKHRQEGELDLRTKTSMLKGGKSGPVIA